MKLTYELITTLQGPIFIYILKLQEEVNAQLGLSTLPLISQNL